MTIKEIEVRTGLPRASVRFYEAEGLISPGRGSNNYRDYSREDCQTLLKIKLLRQLGCPLEDIRTVQAGVCPLETALDRLLLQLEGRRDSLDQAQRLCRQLRADSPQWATLQPQRYLEQLSEPPPPEGDDPRHRIPWRRFSARLLDYALCRLVWALVLTLGFRVNILRLGLLYAAAPPHRGALTPSELAENYNHLAVFSSRGEADHRPDPLRPHRAGDLGGQSSRPAGETDGVRPSGPAGNWAGRAVQTAE